MALKLISRRNPAKLGYSQANYPNPPQPPTRGGLFNGFNRRPSSPVN